MYCPVVGSYLNAAAASAGLVVAGIPVVAQLPLMSPEIGEPDAITFRPLSPPRLNLILTIAPAFSELTAGVFDTVGRKPVKS
jgi:hypothetical protein